LFYQRLTAFVGPDWPEFNDEECLEGRKGPRVGFMQGRVRFFNMLLRQMKRIGIPIKWSQKVAKYFEDENATHAGVELESGEVMTADIVIAAGKRR
jgi:2-polyprenyl-6-methoxyphenol hydroxylase-like FAD-dependent oxidoreductase